MAKGELNAGDLLIKSHNLVTWVVKVERTTKTLAILTNGERINRKTLRAVGDFVFNRPHYWIPKEGEAQRVNEAAKHRKLARKAQEIQMVKLTSEQLEMIIRIANDKKES